MSSQNNHHHDIVKTSLLRCCAKDTAAMLPCSNMVTFQQYHKKVTEWQHRHWKQNFPLENCKYQCCNAPFIYLLGYGSADGRDRIIGGNIDEPYTFPYVAHLDNPSFFCSGSLINENWVISAAHCNVFSWVHNVFINLYNLYKIKWFCIAKVSVSPSN